MSGIWLLLVVCLLILPRELTAQADLRSLEIEEARDRKASALSPEEPSKGERRLTQIERNKWLLGILAGTEGWRLSIGGLAPGAGFAIGPAFRKRELLEGMLDIGFGVRASPTGAYLGSGYARMSHLWNDRAFVETSAVHRNLNRQAYYGPGPESKRTGRSAFRLEDTLAETRAGFRPIRGMRIGAIGGFLAVNTGPGDTSRFISAEKQFPAATTPGIDRQSSFWRAGAFAEYDWRKGGTESTGGGRYLAEWVRNSDRDFSLYSNSRLDLDATHYQPFWNKTHVIAMHAHSTLTDVRRGQQMPFYLQPTLGGPDNLRGFAPFRFYGDNSVIFNLEYRWEASAGLDVALFADGGKVFQKWEQLNFHGLESSFGAGLRFKMRENLATRIDIGASREGVRIWFRFSNAF